MKKIINFITLIIMLLSFSGCTITIKSQKSAETEVYANTTDNIDITAVTAKIAETTIIAETITAAETAEENTKPAAVISYTPLTTDEARTLASGLWDKFMIVRGYYSNDGLPVDYETESFMASDMEYRPVTGEIKTVADLKNVTEQTVTKEYAENNFYVNAINGNMPLYIEKNGVLYESDPPGIGYPEEWHFDTLTIKEQTENALTVTAEVYIWTDEKTLTGEINFVKSDGGDIWRINNFDYFT